MFMKWMVFLTILIITSACGSRSSNENTKGELKGIYGKEEKWVQEDRYHFLEIIPHEDNTVCIYALSLEESSVPKILKEKSSLTGEAQLQHQLDMMKAKWKLFAKDHYPRYVEKFNTEYPANVEILDDLESFPSDIKEFMIQGILNQPRRGIMLGVSATGLSLLSNAIPTLALGLGIGSILISSYIILDLTGVVKIIGKKVPDLEVERSTLDKISDPEVSALNKDELVQGLVNTFKRRYYNRNYPYRNLNVTKCMSSLEISQGVSQLTLDAGSDEIR